MTLNFTYKYYFFKIHVIMIITAKIKFYPHSGGRPLYDPNIERQKYLITGIFILHSDCDRKPLYILVGYPIQTGGGSVSS